MCYYEYHEKRTPIVGDVLQCQMETDIAVGKYAVAVVNKDRAVGHMIKEKTGKFTKIVFFFLRAEVSTMVTVKINRKAVNKGKGEGMEVPK